MYISENTQCVSVVFCLTVVNAYELIFKIQNRPFMTNLYNVCTSFRLVGGQQCRVYAPPLLWKFSNISFC